MASFSVEALSTGNTLNVVKLEEWNTQRPVLLPFVLGGTVAKIDVPLGVYRVKIATGDTSYGLEDLFGAATLAQSGYKPMQFYASGNTITGHTVYLQRAEGNNFPTTKAGRREF